MSAERTTQLLESINGGIVSQFLNEATVYPATLTNVCKGIAINNCSAVAELTVTLTFRDGVSTIAIPVPANEIYSGTFEDFIKVTAAGATPFDIEVRK